jgi:methyl-accepting chemotaxis protein
MQRGNVQQALLGGRLVLARRGVYVGLLPAPLCLAVGILMSGLGAASFGSTAATLGFGMAIGWVATWAMYVATVARPLAHIVNTTIAQANADTAVLSDAMTAVAEGDLTHKIQMRARPSSVVAASEVERLGDGLGQFVSKLVESAEQLNSMTDEPCRRLFYIGPDGYLQGQTGGEVMGAALKGRGQVLVVTPSIRHLGLEVRRKGFEGMLRERFPEMEIVETLETLGEGPKMRAATAAALKRHPRVSGIFVTVSGGSVAAAVSDAGLAGKLTIVSHDLVEEAMPFVANGTIAAAIGQDPYGQGHDPVIHLFNHLVAGWQPPKTRILTAMDVITPANVASFWKTGKGVMESEAMAARRPRPMRASPKHLRIAVLGIEESAFWSPVRAGALAAAEELKAYNVEVQWIVPEPSKAFELGPRSEAIEALAHQGWDAIATPINDSGLVESINRAVSAGVPVATFNSESSSLRGLMDQLSHRAAKLMDVSTGLVGSAAASGTATSEIAENISQMAEAATNEATAMTRANASLERIAESVDAIAGGARDQAAATDSLTSAATHIAEAVSVAGSSSRTVVDSTVEAVTTAERGSEAIRQTLQQMKSIETAVDTSAVTIQETNARAQQIGEIVGTIEDIAAQTNLLALNAAIEAARAGDQGKGFAVVASEVRKLAEKSATATKEIGAIITNIQVSAQRAAEAMDVAIQKVHDGSSLAQHSGEALDQLLESAKETRRQTGEMAAATQTVTDVMGDLTSAIGSVSGVATANLERSESAAASIRETLEIVESVAAISEENAASAERVVYSTVLVSRQAQEVNDAATELTGIARELQGSVARFKLSSDEEDEAPAATTATAGAPKEVPAATTRRSKAA